MCGIVGYIGDRRAAPILLEGLRRLEYRGYDSAGLAIFGDPIDVHKQVGRVKELHDIVPQDLEGSSGIAHTRWATHGGVTVENAHPHIDSTGRIAVVHNGIIENATLLRERLESEGVAFRSDTDTEVLAHLIAKCMKEDADPISALQTALRLVRGTWGIAVLFSGHGERIIAARNGSPLVVGLGDGETFLASDPHALVPFTRRVVYLQDGEIAEISASGVKTQLLDGAAQNPVVETLEAEWAEAEKGSFPNFMLKEIHEQPEALRRCLSGRVVVEDGRAKLGGLELSSRELVGVKRVGLLGCGTAHYACRVGATAIEQLARVPASAEVASEFRHRNPVIDPNSLYFAVSQSGETADTLGAVREVQIKGGQARGVVNVVGSSIARECASGVYIHSGPEMAVASTKAFSNMVAALYLFTLQLARARTLAPHEGRAFAEELMTVPDLVGDYLAKDIDIDPVVEWIRTCRSVLFLGRGLSAAVAAEGALKLMELAYVPCLSYPSGEMKHGPIALLEEGSPVIVIAPEDEVRDKTLSNLQECRARGARVALIHTEGDPIARHADVSISVPRTSRWFTPFLTVLPLQLLAYRTALSMGRDIDRPRNLAKSVTVE
ncbi:MAG: glutamine--fructose-6-phosphate transaminase (isomerizing) [Myxococcota bacterium]|nr:glutamine--fructose-6-phosphate transaminase (isomerizing) [Myxococcota bacterium]